MNFGNIANAFITLTRANVTITQYVSINNKNNDDGNVENVNLTSFPSLPILSVTLATNANLLVSDIYLRRILSLVRSRVIFRLDAVLIVGYVIFLYRNSYRSNLVHSIRTLT